MSDVYVRLGYEFNIACRAFSAIGVETSDLGPVPDMLRSILEETLSQEASQASLDRFLPRIRDIVINLLQGLKKKQQRLRHRTPRESSTSSASASGARQTSTASMSDILDDLPSRQSSRQAPASRQESVEKAYSEEPPKDNTTAVSSTSAEASSIHRQDSVGSLAERLRRGSESQGDDPPSDLPVFKNSYQASTSTDLSSGILNGQYSGGQQRDLPLPRVPQKQSDALAALQRGGDLERRASRRFSQYQIQKHLGGSSNLAAIPPTQRSPIPNRGRHTPESSAPTVPRSTYLSYQAGSPKLTAKETSPTRAQPRLANHLTTSSLPSLEPSNENSLPSSPVVKTPDDKLRQSFVEDGDSEHKSIAPRPAEAIITPSKGAAAITTESNFSQTHAIDTPKTTQPAADSTQEESGKPHELILFLQYKNKVKKFVLNEPSENLSIARLQLAFIEKFSWNTHNNGVELPEIYIQDARSGVRHEIEDLGDVKDDSILVLNVDALDEVKRHLDDSVVGLRNMIDGVRAAVNDQQSAIQRVSDSQQEATKEMIRIAATPPAAQSSTREKAPLLTFPGSTSQIDEVQNLRRELAIMRQTYSGQLASMEAAMTTLREKATAVKNIAVTASTSPIDSDSGRGYVNKGKKTLSDDSEKIISRVDDLQDTVEDLRKDVVSRGVRPLPRQLDTVSKEISAATAELKRLKEFMRREKPVWTKVGEAELKAVCDDQNLLSLQEELAADLEDDLEKAAQTFALVEEATRQQNIQNGASTPTRSTSRTLTTAGGVLADPQAAKEGVLGEVRALQPNHETRLEAIERAERARQLELGNREEQEFKKELNNFVEEGKLKKSGGVEEAERLRKARDERLRKEEWERRNGQPQPDQEAPDPNTATSEIVNSQPGESEPGTKRSSSSEGVYEEAQEQQAPQVAGNAAATITTEASEPT